MRILHVTAGIDPKSGGPTRSVKGICRSLAQAGVDVTLFVLHGHHAFDHPCGVKVIYAENTPLSSSSSASAFPLNLSSFSLVHLQGLWDWGLHKMAVACRKAKVPYVISPRGMLDPWALSVKKWKKRLALLVYQKYDLKKAIAFHVTAEMEKEHVRELGYTQPCIVAPNGVEVPETLPEVPVKGEGERRIALFLSRLHPGKGLLTLAEAWAKVKPQGWIMKVVGPDSYGHKSEVLAKLDALGIPHYEQSPTFSTPLHDSDFWLFCDAMNDTEKWSAYRSADLLVHPSVSENFGITIAEGLYAGLPVICTKGTPWKDLVDYQCGWWIDQGVDALVAALREATASSPTQHGSENLLQQMGENGHQLVLDKYSWPAIAQTVIKGYQEILHVS